MTKTFCDRCQNKIKNKDNSITISYEVMPPIPHRITKTYEFCQTCIKAFFTQYMKRGKSDD